MSKHFQTIAGNLWYFVSIYLIDFGILGLFFFSRFDSRDGRYGSGAAIILGLALLTRAKKLLEWHRAFFWIVTVLAVGFPVGILLPAMLKWFQ